MKGCKNLILLGVCALLLAACGKEVVDSRQIDVSDGLAYKHGLTDPYTGIASFKGFGAMPDAIKTYWLRNEKFRVEEWVKVTMSAQVDCDVSYAKGLMSGPVKCTNQSGDTLLTAAIANERFDGPSTIHNPLTGKLFAELNWKAGSPDGKQVYYGKDGKTVVDEFNIAGGQKDGREVVRTEAGDVYADGVWAQGHPSSGTISEDGGSLFTFSDGKKNGPATIYKGTNEPPSKGAYKNDNRDGTWVDPSGLRYDVFNLAEKGGFKSYNPAGDRIFGAPGTRYSGISANAVSVTSTWSEGMLNGPFKAFDQQGKVLLSMTMKDGSIDGVVDYEDPDTKSMAQITVTDGIVADSGNGTAENSTTIVPPTPEERASANAAALASQAAVSFGNPSSASPAAPAPVASAATAPQPPAAPPTPAANAVTSAATANTVATGNTDGSAHAQVPHTYQAGFDCTKAQTPTETTICADPVLSALDADVSAQYRALAKQADASQKSALLSRQRTYLTVRGQCSDERSCIERLTRSRLQDLREQAAKTPGALISTLQSDKASGA
ncbi:hypothetical protein ASD55_17765 [Rhodanobacter sp. Root561]|uniref:lysozyme inhibitor LprI family protein n=1 Tax=Rhodanobacter sp. Root561 TaxID=1736560 RepID=UPI0006F755E2|nr:lysozyme inhibitor LprI family protein [Rhodanobacter sp. Root561]KQZ77891.1 hypothetical protein ASD55_17765 [Rhodanobacter sp. Root561]